MKIVLFYHSLISDWNHGNAHFLRGINTELQKLGHEVITYEPEDGWSLRSLVENCGEEAVDHFNLHFPHLHSRFYCKDTFDPEALLYDADLVIVHEWNDPDVVKAIGGYKARRSFTLLFHDTHHRAVSAGEEMKRYDLSGYDGVLAFGAALAHIYRQEKWADRVWVWHEAADTTTYYPVQPGEKLGDVVWIGNWGDGERTAELHEFIINPVRDLGLKAKFYGVRYPAHALQALKSVGIEYGGWLPTNEVPAIFSAYRATIHVPRRFYTDNLPGIPTIRPFEAMACKIPLLSAPWEDSEGMFKVGEDFLMAEDGEEMKDLLYKVLTKPRFTRDMVDHAFNTIRSRHTCRHRAEQLIGIFREIKAMSSLKMTTI